MVSFYCELAHRLCFSHLMHLATHAINRCSSASHLALLCSTRGVTRTARVLGDSPRSLVVLMRYWRGSPVSQADGYNGVISGLSGVQSVFFFVAAKPLVRCDFVCSPSFSFSSLKNSETDSMLPPGRTRATIQSQRFGERKILIVGLFIVVLAMLAAVPYAGSHVP